MVKKLLWIFVFILLLLVGCSSKDKMETYAIDELEKLYGVELKVTNVERSSTKFPAIFSVFGEFYTLTFETQEEHPVIFTGNIHSKDFNQFHDNYVSAKHESLLQHDSDYQNLYEKLEANGFIDMKLTSAFTKNVQVNVLFKGHYHEASYNVDELMETMTRMAEKIVLNNQYETSIEFTVNAKRYMVDEMKEIPLEYSIYSYSLPDNESLGSILTKQLEQFQSNQAITEELILQLDELLFDISSTLNRANTDNFYQRWYEHRIGLLVLHEYDETRLLQALEKLRDAGMNEAYVQLIFQDGNTNQCQLKELTNSESIGKCFN